MTESKDVASEQVKKEKSKEPAENNKSSKLAVILVRGLVNVNSAVKDTLAMLRLRRKNHCVVIDDNPVNRGMILKVKDYVTWGEVSEDIFSDLITQKGEEFKGRTTDRKKKYSYRTISVKGKKFKPYFRLNPPRKGFGRKGIKVAFKAGGALGYRGKKINDLIKRMI